MPRASRRRGIISRWWPAAQPPRSTRFALAFALGFPFYGVLFFVPTVIMLYRRKRQLQGLTFHLSGPEVPVAILDAVRDAESRFYRDLGFFRRCVEDVQDVLSFVAPELVCRLNASVGPYRIKAESVTRLIDEATGRSYLTIETAPGQTLSALLAYFSMQPVIKPVAGRAPAATPERGAPDPGDAALVADRGRRDA